MQAGIHIVGRNVLDICIIKTMNPIVEEMQCYYERRAPVYDASMGYHVDDIAEKLAPVIQLLREQMRDKQALEIACGPCFWTDHVSKTAASILATDFNGSTLDQARQKNLDWDRITLQVADAYNLSAVTRKFHAAFAVDWFAHVPRSCFHGFLRGLHEKLEPGSRVVFCDQLPYPRSLTGIYDEEGNHLQERTLPDGSRYRIIKHFLSDDEITSVFSPYTNSVEISRFPGCRRIVVSYLYCGDKR